MAIKFRQPESHDLKPRITVLGVGGAGGNAVNNMIDKALEGAEFIAANTDSQALQQSKADRRIQLGAAVTGGLGAGAAPDVGAGAAEESRDEIVEALSGANMCFITAGMGGGTGTGAAPVIAQMARDLGILTVGVVTKPFAFEGPRRMKTAEMGIEELARVVDTLIIIPNQNLFRIADERTTFAEAFVLADDVLYQGVKGVTDLMVRPGMVNLDFADVRAVMNEMGKAMMGSGEAEGDGRALAAAEKAIANPLLDDITLEGARGVLINITGGYDLTLFEVDEAANRIRNEADPNANVIFGSAFDPEMDGRIRVSVVATGIDAEVMYAVQRPGAAVAAAKTPDGASAETAADAADAEGATTDGRTTAAAEAEPEDRRRFGVDPVDAHLQRARSASRPEAATGAGSPAVATLRGIGAERRFGEQEDVAAPQGFREREEPSRALAGEPASERASEPTLERAPSETAELQSPREEPEISDAAMTNAAARETARPEPEMRSEAAEGEGEGARLADRDRPEPPVGQVSEMVRKIADSEPRAGRSSDDGGRVQIPSFLLRR